MRAISYADLDISRHVPKISPPNCERLCDDESYQTQATGTYSREPHGTTTTDCVVWPVRNFIVKPLLLSIKIRAHS